MNPAMCGEANDGAPEGGLKEARCCCARAWGLGFEV